MVKLMKIIPSDLKGKKWTAYFLLDEKTKKGKQKEKKVSFGQAGARDFTLMSTKSSKHYEKDIKIREKVKKAYQARHAKDNLTDPMSAGALSYYVLWGSPSFGGSIRNFKNKFKLN